MRDKIINLIHENDYVRKDFQGIKEYLNITDSEEIKDLMKLLNILEEECLVMRDKKEKFELPKRLGYFKGVIQVKEKGFGFVVIEDLKDDIFIPKPFVNGALNKDTVFVRSKKSRSMNKSLEGEVVKIIERGTRFIVGTYQEVGQVGSIKPDDKGMDIEILVNKNDSKGAMPSHKVKAEIISFLSGKKVQAEVIEIIGHKNDPGVDILSVVHKFEHPTEFEEDTLEHAESIKEEVTEDDIKDRVDLRGLDVVTIDGDDAKDLDDAVTVEKLKNGNYKLGVYIADVSHYIKENSPIDNEAFRRGTSVYLADRVIPMIPHRLSNGICSLNPKVNRLVMCCDMEINLQGEVVDYKIFQGVIKTKERMTYNNVNKVLAGDKEQNDKYKSLVPMFKDMEKLAEYLRGRRKNRGSIDFETNESKIIVDGQGKPVDIELRTRGISEKIIEEFMLVANETVAEHIHWLKYPFIYRVHENPNPDKLDMFIKLVRNYGHDIKGTTNKLHQKELQSVLNLVKGRPEEKSINTLLLRSMMKAKYSEESIGHYGLSTKFYTHFTSPIRRYPDTIVHRLLREYIIDGNVDEKTIDKWAKFMPYVGLHTSKKERDAVDCEREVTSMKKAEYMEGKVGEEFEGIISSLTNFGMFIELPNTIEGMVHILDMDDDYYDFFPEKMIMIGSRKKKIFRLGDVVKVRVMSASKEEREVNFELLGVTKPNKKVSGRDFRKNKNTNHKPRTNGNRNNKDYSKNRSHKKRR